MRVRPILFNTEMVRAILEGNKTATRRIVKQSVWEDFVHEGGKVIHYFDQKEGSLESPLYKAPCQPGDVLYVRETWCKNVSSEEYYYAANRKDGEGAPYGLKWRPSIHMPKQAARIWLKVTDVRVERLQDISLDDCVREGIDTSRTGIFTRFSMLWDSTIKKEDIFRYGWEANPWVWVIGFERCGKPENEG